MTLPWLIRKVKIEDKFTSLSEQYQEIIIQKKIAQNSLQFLEEKYGQERLKNEYVNILFEKLKIDMNFFNQKFEEINSSEGNSLKDYQSIYLELLQHQRSFLEKMNHSIDCDEEVIRKYFSLIDLEEFKISEKLLKEEDEYS